MPEQEKESWAKRAIHACKTRWGDLKKKIKEKTGCLYLRPWGCLVQLACQLWRWLYRRLDLCLTVFIIILIIIFLVVLFPNFVSEYVIGLFGEKDSHKNEALTFLGLGVGGLVLWQRARSAEKQAEATETGNTQERLKNAVEHLGNKKASARIGAAYELYHLAKDKENYRETVCDILCSHIRQKTQKDQNEEPSEEIKTFLNLLCGKDKGEPFSQCQVDLSSSFLRGAKLQWARLQGADLSGAQLQGVSSSEPFKGNFQGRIRARVGEESDFTTVVFSDGLSADQVKTIIAFMPNSMDDKEKRGIKKRLDEHVGKKASSKLPDNSGAIIGKYSQKDAEKWIAEYEESIKSSVHEK